MLVNNKKEMIGNRIGGVVAAELRARGWGKIVSLGESKGSLYPVQRGQKLSRAKLDSETDKSLSLPFIVNSAAPKVV